MPTICRFHGIVIFMNYNEHNPPHFHARYQGYEVSVEIERGIVRGTMPKRELRMILQWQESHQQLLLDNWRRATDRQPLLPIPPLA